MRILMVLWDDKGFPPDPRVEKEARSLLAAGHEVFLVCRKRPWQQARETVYGIKVKRVNVNLDGVGNILRRGGTRLGFMRHIKWQRALNESLRQVRPDVIHCHDLRPLETVLAVSEHRPYPRVFADLHELYPEAIKYYYQGLWGQLFCAIGRWDSKERAGFERADVVATISSQAQSYYKRKYHKIPEVIRNTVDYHEFDKQVAEFKEPVPDTPRILYAGGYNAKRGIDVLVRAMNIVARETEAHLCLVGPMPKGELTALSTSPKRLEFTGQVAAQRLPALINTATVVVHPLLVNSPQTNYCCPHKVFEYMAAGKPIVASRAESFEEYIESTGAGVLVKPNDEKKLAEILIYLVQHKADAERFGNNGRKAVETKYNWDIDGRRLCEIYENHLGGRQ